MYTYLAQHLENGPPHAIASYAIVGANGATPSQTTLQQPHHQISNLQTNSNHLHNGTIIIIN